MAVQSESERDRARPGTVVMVARLTANPTDRFDASSMMRTIVRTPRQIESSCSQSYIATARYLDTETLRALAR